MDIFTKVIRVWYLQSGIYDMRRKENYSNYRDAWTATIRPIYSELYKNSDHGMQRGILYHVI